MSAAGPAKVTLLAVPVTAADLEQLARLLAMHLGSSGAALLAACLDEVIEDITSMAASCTG